MKTVATKLNNEDYENFINECNESECTPAEKLRQLIKNSGHIETLKKPKKHIIPENKFVDEPNSIPKMTITSIEN